MENSQQPPLNNQLKIAIFMSYLGAVLAIGIGVALLFVGFEGMNPNTYRLGIFAALYAMAFSLGHKHPKRKLVYVGALAWVALGVIMGVVFWITY